MSVLVQEENPQNVAYVFDGTLEGLLSAVFYAYQAGEDPQDIDTLTRLQPRLGQTIRTIDTSISSALRLQRGISRVCGADIFDLIKHASLSDAPQTPYAIYAFIRYALATQKHHPCTSCNKRHSCSRTTSCRALQNKSYSASPLRNEHAHTITGPILRLERAVLNERHRMKQFLRFEQTAQGVWFAKCNPNANVVPLLMDYFQARFGTESFVIYDEIHHVAGICDGKDWQLVQTNALNIPAQTQNELLMQAAWKCFYDAVSIDARYHPELRRQFMPKRFWKNICEMHERMPDKSLLRTSQDALNSPQIAPDSLLSDTSTPVKSKSGIKLSRFAEPSCQ